MRTVVVEKLAGYSRRYGESGAPSLDVRRRRDGRNRALRGRCAYGVTIRARGRVPWLSPTGRPDAPGSQASWPVGNRCKLSAESTAGLPKRVDLFDRARRNPLEERGIHHPYEKATAITALRTTIYITPWGLLPAACCLLPAACCLLAGQPSRRLPCRRRRATRDDTGTVLPGGSAVGDCPVQVWPSLRVPRRARHDPLGTSRSAVSSPGAVRRSSSLPIRSWSRRSRGLCTSRHRRQVCVHKRRSSARWQPTYATRRTGPVRGVHALQECVRRSEKRL